MKEFSVRSNIRQIEDKLRRFAYQQVPFATAQALNALGKQVLVAEQKNEHQVLDRPRPFTTGAIRLVRAKKGMRAEAKVVMLDKTAAYLAPYQFGGQNKLNSKVLLKPVDAKKDLDQYGNLPRNFMAKLKGRSDVFVGTVKTKNGPVTGVWQRASADGVKPTLTRVTKKGKVIVRKVAGYEPSREGRKLKLLIAFDKAHEARQHLDWFGVAGRVITKQFNREFGRALARAIATAK